MNHNTRGSPWRNNRHNCSAPTSPRFSSAPFLQAEEGAPTPCLMGTGSTSLSIQAAATVALSAPAAPDAPAAPASAGAPALSSPTPALPAGLSAAAAALSSHGSARVRRGAPVDSGGECAVACTEALQCSQAAVASFLTLKQSPRNAHLLARPEAVTKSPQRFALSKACAAGSCCCGIATVPPVALRCKPPGIWMAPSASYGRLARTTALVHSEPINS